MCSLISAKLLLIFSNTKGIRIWLSAFPLMYHAFSHQCPKYCGINICCWQNVSLHPYSFLLRKSSTKPSVLLCSGTFVHYSRNKERKRVCQCESFIKLVFLWSCNSPLQFRLSQLMKILSPVLVSTLVLLIIFITLRDLPNDSPSVHGVFKVLVTFFSTLFYKCKLNFC